MRVISSPYIKDIGGEEFCIAYVKNYAKMNELVRFWLCRNFPQGNIGDMVDDVTAGIGWVISNIETYGGDPARCAIGHPLHRPFDEFTKQIHRMVFP